METVHKFTLVLGVIAAVQLLVVFIELNDLRIRKQRETRRKAPMIPGYQRIKAIQLVIEKRLRFLNATAKKERSRLPDAILIGSTLCGARTLLFYLRNHPLVRTNTIETHHYDRHRRHNLKHYRSLLPYATEDEIILENSPSYFIVNRKMIPSQIKHDNPKVKLLLVVCDPVLRASSEFNKKRETKAEWKSLTFESHIEHYLERVQNVLKKGQRLSHATIKNLTKDQNLSLYASGAYSVFLRLWEKSFHRNRIKVIQGEALKKNPGNVLESVQTFLSLPIVLKERDFTRSDGMGVWCLKPWWITDYYKTDVTNFSKHLDSKLLCYQTGNDKFESMDDRYLPSTFAAEKLKNFYEPYNGELFAISGQRWTQKVSFSTSSHSQRNTSLEDSVYF